MEELSIVDQILSWYNQITFHWNQGQLMPVEELTLDLQQNLQRSNKQAGKSPLFHCLNRMRSLLSTGFSSNPQVFGSSRILCPKLKNGNTQSKRLKLEVLAGDIFPGWATLCPAPMIWQWQPALLVSGEVNHILPFITISSSLQLDAPPVNLSKTITGRNSWLHCLFDLGEEIWSRFVKKISHS